jgi:hypothetical protein
MKCKNDPTKSYTGTEPSPKGRGYCAHAVTPGTMATGKDGRDWVVKLDKNNVRSWKPANGPTPSTKPMTVPYALKLLAVDADESSVVALKVAHLKAVAAFRRKYPPGVNYGYDPIDIHKAYRFLLVRMGKRGLAPESFGDYVTGKKMKEPVEYKRLMAQAVRIFASK